MEYRIPSVVLVAALIIGCSENQSGPTEVLTPNFDGVSGCYTVKFNVAVAPTGPTTFEGPVTGDLVGTVEFVFDSEPKITGTTVAVGGIANWDITGGILGPLTFQTRFNQRNHLIDRPGSPATLFENTGQHRALGGVEKANLTYKGTFDVLADPAPLGDADHQGVICP